MCCCFKKRNTPACIVFVLSFLAVVAGIAMIYFAVKLNNSQFMDKISEVEDLKEKIDFDYARKWIFFYLIIFSCLAIICAVLGMFACNTRTQKWYIRLYGILLLPTWMVIIGVGGTAVYYSTKGKDMLMEECFEVVTRD